MSVLEELYNGSGLDKEAHTAQRKELYSKDKSLLQDKGVVISPENIDVAENRRLTIQYDNTDFECFLYRKDRFIFCSVEREKKKLNCLVLHAGRIITI